jgi:ribosome-associated protein
VTSQQAEHRSPSTQVTQPRGGQADDRSRQVADAALAAALDKKALEPVLLEVRELCSYADYILLVSGRSDRQVDAITDGVADAMKKLGVRPLGVEGTDSGHWALLDYGDVVIHVFHHPVRRHYDLEGLWIDAKRVEIDVPDEARAGPDDLY